MTQNLLLKQKPNQPQRSCYTIWHYLYAWWGGCVCAPRWISGCVTQVDLKSVPLFWKPYGEGAPKREPRSQPTGEDTASSTGMGRRFSKVPDFSEITLSDTWLEGLRLPRWTFRAVYSLSFPLPSDTLTPKRACASTPQWAKHWLPPPARTDASLLPRDGAQVQEQSGFVAAKHVSI